MTIPAIEPSDHLLYGVGGFDIFNRITRLKTWSPAVHVEICVDKEHSVASRNGLGVSLYPLRTKGLIAVLTPNQLFCVEDGMEWFNVSYDKNTGKGVRGRPYGWLDLFQFYNLKLKTDGWICSQFASYFDEACAFQPFNAEYDDGMVDPGDFLVSPAFTWKWIDPTAKRYVQKI